MMSSRSSLRHLLLLPVTAHCQEVRERVVSVEDQGRCDSLNKAVVFITGAGTPKNLTLAYLGKQGRQCKHQWKQC